MAKKKKVGRPSRDKYLTDTPRAPLLKKETTHTILAISAYALAIFFILAYFDQAGRAGHLVFQTLDKLLGAGFLLLPSVAIILGTSFLKVSRPNLVLTKLIAGIMLFLATLGAISVIFEPSTGGIAGELIASPLLALFDYWFSLIAVGAISTIALFIIFDTQLTLEKKLFFWRFGHREELTTDTDEAYPPATPPLTDHEPRPSDTAKENNSSNDKNDAKEIKTPSNNDGLFHNLNPFKKTISRGAFVPPPLSLLARDSGKPVTGDIKANMNIIRRTLANFGINVEMDEVSIGPSVTRYALKPAEGVKLSRIVALQNDLSLSLAAHPLRIEAPIPGKSLVGIEIPNSTKATVGLATLLSAKDYTESPHPLYVALGKGISGLAHFTNIAKAPHMLIAGATGSGKSVTIHTLIASLLYRNPPEQLRFIMIDPKRVELTLYNKIPHLLTPVITDPKKAIMALRWAAKEMDRRYDILEEHSVRDIQSYHKNILSPRLVELEKANKNKTEETAEENDIETMPYIVIIIDELADIMSSYPRELEAAIVRLAQMSRAVGIHLILSTQRPSVDVITGLIKANIPSRIALQVASQIDSRTIIDMPGAEKLLGAGDMLFLSGEMSKPARIQSAFISENEVKQVVSYLAEHNADFIPSEINLQDDRRQSGNGALVSTSLDAGDDDDLYEDARQAVIEAGKASASYLQRKLKIGYARAARMIDMLEERGVVGPGDGAKPREILLSQPREANDQEEIN